MKRSFFVSAFSVALIGCTATTSPTASPNTAAATSPSPVTPTTTPSQEPGQTPATVEEPPITAATEITGTEEPAPIPTPLTLSYAPKSLDVTHGASALSPIPSTNRAVATFSISAISPAPASGTITIDAQTGRVTADATVPHGSYVVSVSADGASFAEAFTFVVKDAATAPPADLVYAPNNATFAQFTSSVSPVPTISNTPITEFSILDVVPQVPGGTIAIDKTTGVITATNITSPGQYIVHVTAQNAAGAQDFYTAFTFTVTQSGPQGSYPTQLHYGSELDVIPGNEASSEAPTFEGTAPITFSLVGANVEGGADIDLSHFSIDALTGVITAKSTLPAAPIDTYGLGLYRYSVRAKATNMWGSQEAALTVNARPADGVTALAYQPALLEVTKGVFEGQSIVMLGSATAKIQNGTGASFAIAYTNPPGLATNLSIDSVTGKISVKKDIPVSGYNPHEISVKVMKNGAPFLFPLALRVKVKSGAPSSLVYTPNAFTVGTNMAAVTSQAMTIVGGPITNWQLVGNANAAITINASTGVITVTNAQAAGTFALTVRATNAIGSTDFPAAMTITVKTPLSYTSDVMPLLGPKCSSCHVYGTSGYYPATKSHIDDIISRVQGAGPIMPPSGPTLTAAEVQKLKDWKATGFAM